MPIRYQRRADVMFTTVDGEVLALDVEHGQCFGMNAVASEVWALLELPRTLEEICAELVETFDVEVAHCQREVGELLERFRADALITAQPVS